MNFLLIFRSTKTLIILLFIFLCSANGNAQFPNTTIQLLTKNPTLKISYVPFEKVIVLDNRVDTSNIYTFETGQYPVEFLRFDKPASIAIKDYIEKAIAPIKKGRLTLLVNIKELHIPNLGIYVKANAKGIFSGDRYYYTRDYLRFYSEIYFQIGDDTYKKIANLRFSHFWRPTSEIDGRWIKLLINELIACASASEYSVAYSNGLAPKKKKYWAKDTVAFDFCNEVNNYRIEQINIPAIERWGKIFTLQSSNLKDGVYDSFEDFKNGKTSSDSGLIIFDEKDSIYKMNLLDSSRFLTNKKIWGICCSGSLYIRFGVNQFLKTFNYTNTFEFQIPYSLPDMYTILSLRANYQMSGTSITSSGNIIADLTSAFARSAVDRIIKNATEKKINKESIKHNFRTCFIDMDNGDIIY